MPDIPTIFSLLACPPEDIPHASTTLPSNDPQTMIIYTNEFFMQRQRDYCSEETYFLLQA